MSFIYKTVYYPKNPKAEYQKQGKHWVKRAKGSKSAFYDVEADNALLLDKHFANKGALYFYTDAFKVSVGIAIAGIIYFGFIKKFGVSNKGTKTVKPIQSTNVPK